MAARDFLLFQAFVVKAWTIQLVLLVPTAAIT